MAMQTKEVPSKLLGFLLKDKGIDTGSLKLPGPDDTGSRHVIVDMACVPGPGEYALGALNGHYAIRRAVELDKDSIVGKVDGIEWSKRCD